MIPNLVSLRQYVDTTLTATGTVRRLDGMGVDPETGADVPIYLDLYAGRLLVYATVSEPETSDVSGAPVTITDYTVTLPANTAVEVGDVVKVTASTNSPGIVGREFRITNAPAQEWAVATIVRAEVVQ